VQDYRLVQRRTGTSRVVIVTPRYYATDNRVTLDALQQLGASARGVAVANQTVTDAELKSLNDGGIRGIPFTLGDPATAVVRWEMVEPLAKRIADLDRHLQFNIDGELIVANWDLLRRLPTQLVFDHMGQPPLPAGPEHASFAILRGLIDRGRPGSNCPPPMTTARSARPTTRRRPGSQRPSPRRRRSAWCGAATGLTVERKTSSSSRTTPCCSTFSPSGRPRRRLAGVFSSRTRRTCTALRNPRESCAGPNACAPRPCWPVLVGAGFRRISLPVLLTHRRRGSHNGLSSA
jgi:hypothetical protein